MNSQDMYVCVKAKCHELKLNEQKITLRKNDQRIMRDDAIMQRLNSGLTLLKNYT